MAKKSGKFEPTDSSTGESGESGESSEGSPPAETPTKRRRRKREASSPGKSQKITQKYRGILIGAVAIIAIGFVGFVILQSATVSAYTCDSLLAATPVSTEDGAQLGAAQDDGGRTHQEGTVRYATCPPTSGSHRAGGALTRQFYDASSEQPPNNWVHNLEHGYAIIAYKGDPGAEVLDQLRTVMEAPAPSDIAVQCGLPNKVIAVRFDGMAEPFAVLAWDRALVMSSLDTELMTRAAEEFQDQPQAPEQAC